jgi:hypothetical protein
VWDLKPRPLDRGAQQLGSSFEFSRGPSYDLDRRIVHDDNNALRILNVSVTLSQQTLRVGTIMFLRHMPHVV